MSSLNQKEILMKKTGFLPEIIENIFEYDVDFNANKVMDDLSEIIEKIHNEEKLIEDLIEEEHNRINSEENDFVASILLEDGNHEIEILNQSEPRKNINKYLKIIADYFEKNNKITNNIIKGYFDCNIDELSDCNILNFFDSQYIKYENCKNTKFLNFLNELSYIYQQWSIDYYDYSYNNYDSDIDYYE